MATAEPLTPEQIQFFKDQGYLVLDNLVDPGLVKSWQKNIADFFSPDPSCQAPDPINFSKKSAEGFRFSPPESALWEEKICGEAQNNSSSDGPDRLVYGICPPEGILTRSPDLPIGASCWASLHMLTKCDLKGAVLFSGQEVIW
jgi:hypothetical protein